MLLTIAPNVSLTFRDPPPTRLRSLGWTVTAYGRTLDQISAKQDVKQI